MAAAIRLSQQHSCSFDHLIGGGEQLVRHGETEHPGRLSVDDKLKLGRLHDRQLCRLRAFEDAASIDPRLTPRICSVGSVAHQSTGLSKVAHWIRRRYRVASR